MPLVVLKIEKTFCNLDPSAIMSFTSRDSTATLWPWERGWTFCCFPVQVFGFLCQSFSYFIGQDYLLIMADKQVFILEGDNQIRRRCLHNGSTRGPKVLLAFSTNSDVRGLFRCPKRHHSTWGKGVHLLQQIKLKSAAIESLYNPNVFKLRKWKQKLHFWKIHLVSGKN